MTTINTGLVEEIDKAIGIIRKLTVKAHGVDWHTVYVEEPEDTILVGVETEDEEFVVDGASMGGDGVTDEDAEFITMMDPGMAHLLLTFLESTRDGIRSGQRYLHGESFSLSVAYRINNKFGKEQYGVPTSRRR